MTAPTEGLWVSTGACLTGTRCDGIAPPHYLFNNGATHDCLSSFHHPSSTQLSCLVVLDVLASSEPFMFSAVYDS